MSGRSPARLLADEIAIVCPPDAQCTTPDLVSGGIAYGEVERPFSYYIQTTGDFVALSVTGLPSWAEFDHASRSINGIPTAAGDTLVSITAKNDCGEDHGDLLISISALFMIWGNWRSPLPTVPFVQADLLDLTKWDTSPGSYNIKEEVTRLGTFEFAFPTPPSNWFQVMWIPESLLGKAPDPLISIKVQGFNFNLQPANNTPLQSLVMFGIPGQLFVSAAPNNGGFTVAGGNPWTIA